MERPEDRGLSGPHAAAARPSSGVVLWVALVAALLSGVSGLTRPPARPSSRPTKIKVAPAAPVDPAPRFSSPTAITNPLLPVSHVTHVVQIGAAGGDPLRFELTLLPETRAVEWAGRQLPTVVSQLVAYSDGRVVEVARDFHAQADDGSVWHFGEDSANYDDGVLVDHEGSWLAGRDGPPALVMPARPQVAAVFGSQTSPGQRDEVTVQAVDQVVEGPQGPVAGAIRVQERLVDGTIEDKTFAPGYGELHTRVPVQDELSSVAVALPTDALAGPVPEALTAISGEARRIQQSWDGSAATRTPQDWARIGASVQRMSQAWARQGPIGGHGVLAAQVGQRLADLVAAVGARRPAGVHDAATGVAHAALDIQLRHRPVGDVDRDRLRLWAHQVVVDAATGETAAVDGDVVVLEAIWARSPPAPAERAAIGAMLADLRAAAAARDLARISTIATGMAAAP